jgi:hypothetical protein
MSHFSVMVVGEDIDQVLAPFDENLKVTPYRKYMDRESIQRMAKNYDLIKEKDELFPESRYKELLPHMEDWDRKEGFLDEEGKLYTFSTYNPKSKWDWYEAGGRWAGLLLSKSGEEVFSCKKKDIAYREGEKQRVQAIMTFALLYKGEWHEEGAMGWWGMVSNEKEAFSWEKEFNTIFDSIPDEETITIVDCHI